MGSPTVLAIETDSAWVVILAVSAATFLAVLALRKIISRPGGLASGVLALLPLAVPLVAAGAFAHAALPELSVLRPASPSLVADSGGLLHLLLLRDESTGLVTPYTLVGSAGRWLVVIAILASVVMLVRRGAGMLVVRSMKRRCRPAWSPRERWAEACLHRLGVQARLPRRPELEILPEDHSGAFAVGGPAPRVLISEDVLAALDDDELEGALAHEVAHLQAHDLPVVFLGGLLRDLVAWNPLAHLSFRRLAADREFEADRRAAALTGRPLDVASGLLKVCELMGTRCRRHGAAISFRGSRAFLQRRVRGLMALADHQVVLDRTRRTPFVVAGILVAVLGLQVGARVAAQETGAFAFVLGSASGNEAELWAPKASRHHHEGPTARHEVKAARSPSKARRVRSTPSARYPERSAAIALKGRNVDAWMKWMERRLRRKPRLVKMWMARHDWNMVPIVSEPMGVGVRVFRLW